MDDHIQQGPSGHQLTLPIRGNLVNEQAPGDQLIDINTNDFTIARQNIDTNFHRHEAQLHRAEALTQNLVSQLQDLDVRCTAAEPKLAEVESNIKEINQDYSAIYHVGVDLNVKCSSLEEASKACEADRKLTKRQLSAVCEYIGIEGMDHLAGPNAQPRPNLVAQMAERGHGEGKKFHAMDQRANGQDDKIKILEERLDSKDNELKKVKAQMYKMLDLMYKMSTAEISPVQFGNEAKILGEQLAAEANEGCPGEISGSVEKMDEDGNEQWLWG